jgi:hypothetical protein
LSTHGGTQRTPTTCHPHPDGSAGETRLACRCHREHSRSTAVPRPQRCDPCTPSGSSSKCPSSSVGDHRSSSRATRRDTTPPPRCRALQSDTSASCRSRGCWMRLEGLTWLDTDPWVSCSGSVRPRPRCTAPPAATGAPASPPVCRPLQGLGEYSVPLSLSDGSSGVPTRPICRAS